MAQLYYRYSTMNAGKSIEVIKVAHNYEERGKRVLALVPGVDDRYGKGKITSRIGLSRDATIVNEDTNILEIFMRENSIQPIDCVVLDECQFLKKHHVEELIEIVDSFDIPVLSVAALPVFVLQLLAFSLSDLPFSRTIRAGLAAVKTGYWKVLLIILASAAVGLIFTAAFSLSGSAILRRILQIIVFTLLGSAGTYLVYKTGLGIFTKGAGK